LMEMLISLKSLISSNFLIQTRRKPGFLILLG
jgi:hypothetical protein